MMGKWSKSEALFFYFKLEDHVPETHLLRLIGRYGDLGISVGGSLPSLSPPTLQHTHVVGTLVRGGIGTPSQVHAALHLCQ